MAKTPKIIPVSDLRQKTKAVFENISDGEPVFITQRGRATAVMISMSTYEHAQQELDILRLLASGEKDIEAGTGYELDDVLKEADRFIESQNP